MTPAEDVIETQPTCRHARTSSKRNRHARSGTRLTHRSSGVDKAQRSAAAAPPDRFRHKLAKAAAQACEDAYVGLMVLTGLFFTPTLVMLASAGIDKAAGTALSGLANAWYPQAKLAAIAAEMLWAVLFLAPAGVLSWWLSAQSGEMSISCKRIRPVVDAIAVYATLFIGVAAVWNMPSSPRPPEFEIPGPEVYQARLAMLELRLIALHCMKDASPPRCTRPDIQRIQAHYYLEWLEKAPSAFERERDWS